MIRYFLLAFALIFPGISLFSQERSIDYYIASALSSSPLLKDLNNQRKDITTDSLLVHANRAPRVGLNGTLFYAPTINGYGYSDVITNGSLFSSVVNVSQDIFTGKTTEAQIAKLGIQNQSLVNTGKLTEKELKNAITAQYLVVYFLTREIASNTDILKSLENEDHILFQLAEKGIYRQTDYLSFLLERQSQQLANHETNNQYRKELMQLNLLCGIQDTASVTLAFPQIETAAEGSPIASPFFKRFLLDSLSIQNERMLLDRNYKPKISWFTDAGLVNNLPGEIYKNFGVSLGINLSLPIYDGNQRKLNYQKLKTWEETRKTYQDYFSRQFDQQLQQLKEELARTKSMIPEIEGQVSTAVLLVKTDKELLEKGGLPVTDYVIAIRNYFTIKRNLLQYQKKVLEIIAEINYWRQ